MTTKQFGYQGQQDPYSDTSEFNAQQFVVTQILNRIATTTLVVVRKVTNTGGVSPVGFVDVQPMVNQLDGAHNAVPHGIIHNIPYFRMQGGTDAIIMDPKVGDIGMCGFCSRDISSVKVSKGIANPGSLRTFDMADGLYFGGMLNGVPTQYIQFTTTGINVVSPTKITCTSPNIEMDATGSFAVNSPVITLNGAVSQGGGSYAGNSTFAGTMTVTINAIIGGKNFLTHTHGGVQTGSGTTGAPT